MLVTKLFLISTNYLYSIFFHIMEVNEKKKVWFSHFYVGLVTHILQNI